MFFFVKGVNRNYPVAGKINSFVGRRPPDYSPIGSGGVFEMFVKWTKIAINEIISR